MKKWSIKSCNLNNSSVALMRLCYTDRTSVVWMCFHAYMLLWNVQYKKSTNVIDFVVKFHKVHTQVMHKHRSKHRHVVVSISFWSPCILGKLAARLHAQSDQLFKLPWALWVFQGFIRSSCWKFGTMKNMMHGEWERERHTHKYHRDSSAMCHLLQSRQREKWNIWFSKRRME